MPGRVSREDGHRRAIELSSKTRSAARWAAVTCAPTTMAAPQWGQAHVACIAVSGGTVVVASLDGAGLFDQHGARRGRRADHADELDARGEEMNRPIPRRVRAGLERDPSATWAQDATEPASEGESVI